MANASIDYAAGDEICVVNPDTGERVWTDEFRVEAARSYPISGRMGVLIKHPSTGEVLTLGSYPIEWVRPLDPRALETCPMCGTPPGIRCATHCEAY